MTLGWKTTKQNLICQSHGESYPLSNLGALNRIWKSQPHLEKRGEKGTGGPSSSTRLPRAAAAAAFPWTSSPPGCLAKRHVRVVKPIGTLMSFGRVSLKREFGKTPGCLGKNRLVPVNELKWERLLAFELLGSHGLVKANKLAWMHGSQDQILLPGHLFRHAKWLSRDWGPPKVVHPLLLRICGFHQ